MMITKQNATASSFVSLNHHHSLQMDRTAAGPFVVASKTLILQTEDAPHFIDLTSTVSMLAEHTGITDGTVLVFSKHTTAAIVVTEHEPLLLEDIAQMLGRLVPHTAHYRYRHDDMTIRTVNLMPDEPENGHAHCQHLFLGASIQFPLAEGRLDLGQWQRIFLVELDRPRLRQVVVQVSGVRESLQVGLYGL